MQRGNIFARWAWSGCRAAGWCDDSFWRTGLVLVIKGSGSHIKSNQKYTFFFSSGRCCLLMPSFRHACYGQSGQSGQSVLHWDGNLDNIGVQKTYSNSPAGSQLLRCVWLGSSEDRTDMKRPSLDTLGEVNRGMMEPNCCFARDRQKRDGRPLRCQDFMCR
ncbi:hypothetical protein VTI74DRAFT_3747 [Chaetomium olivicolor]